MASSFSIKRLCIKRFRGLKDVSWNPAPGINLILGGGDCGKTTILEAIGLLLSPTNTNSLIEADFHNRAYDDGFEIEAVVSVTDGAVFASGNMIYWPWKWSGTDAVPPDVDEETAQSDEHYFKIAVTATSDFELSWEIIQPDGARQPFPVSLRRLIGLVRLGAEDRSDRDLRLVYGSALDRLISDVSLRAKISNEIAKIPMGDQLAKEAREALSLLSGELAKVSLPTTLTIGLTGSQGVTIGSMVGLFANHGEVSLPLTSWGTGTRRMVAMHVAAANKDETSVIGIDEIERGLEPYRLRQFLASLEESKTQAFITTHSPVAISAALKAQLWFLDVDGKVGALKRGEIGRQQARDPETFLARVPVLVEGETEHGFVEELLRVVFGGDPLNAGTRVCLAQGNEQILELLKALNGANLIVAGFADDEGTNSGSWAALKSAMGDRLFRWPIGCTEEQVLNLLPDDYLENLFKDEEGDWDGYRLRYVADRLRVADSSFASLTSEAANKDISLRRIIIESATGKTEGAADDAEGKAWKKHAQNWFKKADGSGGRELLRHLKESGKWSDLEPSLRPFFNAVLESSGKSKVDKILLP